MQSATETKSTTRCYACDAKATHYTKHLGAASGRLVLACARHGQRTIASVKACVYCALPTRAGSLCLDNDDEGFPQYAHHRCHREACGD